MSAGSNLVVIRNPFDRDIRDERVLPLGDSPTIAHILAEHVSEGEVAVSINGEIITKEEWETRTLAQGEQMIVMPLVQGKVFGVVAQIALAVVAPVVGNAIAGAIGLGATSILGFSAGSIIGMGVNFLGSQLLGGLTAPTKSNLPASSPSFASSPSASRQSYETSTAYSWSPATTQQPGGSVARCYGRHKLYGNIIAGYIESRGYPGEQIAHLLIDLGTGPYLSLSDFKINDQPVANYTGVTISSRLGNINQAILPTFNDTSATHNVGAKVVKGSPVTRDTAGSDFDALEILMVCPNGLWYSNDEGGLNSVEVAFLVEISADGGATWVAPHGTIFMDYATTHPLRRTLRMDNLARGTRYKVRVTNYSIDQTSSRYGDDLYLAEINEVMYNDFQYPRTVLVAVDALATDQLSGSIKFSCMADGAIVRVWNGSAWVSQWSNNPAWVCWDILTQPVLDNSLAVVRYDGLDPSRLDRASFYAWAQFCDVLVPDGKGGTEKRCLFDGVFDTPTSPWDAALEVCASARAQLVMRGTTIMAVFDDARATPVQLFTVGNTAVSSFRETFLPMQDRAASIEVNYIDAAQDYARDALTVVNTAITEAAAQRTQVGLRGVTRASQAWREANWRLKRNELLKRVATISVDIDALACTVGNLIWLQNDVTRWGVGGRAIEGSTTTKLMLDQSVTLESGKTYELKLRLSDDTLVSRAITTAAGTVSAVDVADAFPSAPALYDVYAIGETNKAVKEFIVLDITRDGDQRAKLSLIEYNASLYGLDSGIPALPTIDIQGNIITGVITPLPVVSNIRVIEVMELSAGGVIQVHLDIYFEMADAHHVAVYESGAGAIEVLTSPCRRNNVTSGQTYNFTLRPFGFAGESPASTWQNITHAVIGKLTPPLDVTGFVATRNGGDLFFNWAPNAELDVAGYEIRLGASWDTAVVVGKTVHPSTAMATVSPQGGTFLIKAFDTCAPTPNYSVTAAQCILASNDAINVVVTDDDATYGWPGTLTGMVKAGAVLNLAYAKTWADLTQPWSNYTRSWMAESEPAQAGNYITDTHDLGEVLSCNLHVTPDLQALALGQTWSGWSLPWSSYGNNFTWEGPLGAITATYEIDTSLDGITWTGWQPFTPGLRTLRYYKMRASFTAQPGYQIQLNHFTITVDVPDRVERYANQAVSSGGLSLVFSPAFRAVQTVKVNLLNGLAGDRYTISNKTVNGMDINVYDNALAAKAGTVDVEVFGY